MPGRTETALYESGRATAPPGVRYTSITGSASETGYNHPSTAATSSTNPTAPFQSPRYAPNYTNYVQQRPQASPRYTPSYSPCPSPSPNYQTAISKPSSLPSQSPQYTPNYSATSHSTSYSSSFGSSSNFPNFNNNNNSNNFEIPSTSSNNNGNNLFPTQENLFNIPKAKPTATASASPRYTPNYSNFSYFSNNQVKYPQGKADSVDSPVQKPKNDCEIAQNKKCEGELNYNIGELQQFLSKHGAKIKDSAQDLVTDSLLNFLQRKNFEKSENFFESDVPACGKKEDSDRKAKEEDPKLMNDLLSKLSEKEEKRIFNENKKKNKILDDLNLDIKKRDAMSHYQDDKSHHKRNSNYGDFNQWDFLNQQDLQGGNNRRGGHLPFQAQSHGMAWNPMGMQHQSNPYYQNPHHAMPAHAHEYQRYNQWNNPNHKNTNIQNAHAQNKNQVKNSNQDFNLLPPPMSLPRPDFPKNPTLRTPPLKQISNPLTDLQMLVTNQENDKPAEKEENYQAETVDLSAHSDAKKIPAEPKKNEAEDNEKPVELTAKNPEKPAEKEISSTNPKTPEKPAKSPEPDIRKSEDDDEIAKQLALLDGGDKKSPEPPKPPTPQPPSSTPTLQPTPKPAEPPAEPESKKVFIEVENELEKMFEGVEEKPEKPAEKPAEKPEENPTVSSTSTDVIKPSTSEGSKKTPRKKPPRNARSSRLSSGQSSSSENQSHKKKKRKGLGKDDGSAVVKKKVKKNLCDVMDSSRKGPVLHVEGTRECPTSVIVVNYPKGDDEDERDKSLAKKQAFNSSRIKHHNELDYRGRSRNGLFSSTLSARYDAHTTDYSWICVFCKKGPHYNALGDLFGPYIITKDENTSLCDFSGDEKDISDAQKRGGRNKKSIRSNNMVDHFQKMSKKLRRHHSGESNLTGMTLVSDDQIDELRYEVWVHEQCAVWSPNVCLIGSRIVGMQEAIWSSVKTMCSKCGENGANLGCVHRNCPNRSHYDCARQSGWCLEQETFISTCHIHKARS